MNLDPSHGVVTEQGVRSGKGFPLAANLAETVMALADKDNFVSEESRWNRAWTIRGQHVLETKASDANAVVTQS